MNQEEIARIHQRLASVERKNRQLKWLLLLLPLLLGTAVAADKMTTFDTIVANTIVIKDTNDPTINRMVLTVDPNTNKNVLNVNRPNGTLFKALGEQE